MTECRITAINGMLETEAAKTTSQWLLATTSLLLTVSKKYSAFKLQWSHAQVETTFMIATILWEAKQALQDKCFTAYGHPLCEGCRIESMVSRC
eukprot:scaffold223118_cov21-Prasinocladus_malaysianus.AAC.1